MCPHPSACRVKLTTLHSLIPLQLGPPFAVLRQQLPSGDTRKLAEVLTGLSTLPLPPLQGCPRLPTFPSLPHPQGQHDVYHPDHLSLAEPFFME